jgi:hypothetical protein
MVTQTERTFNHINLKPWAGFLCIFSLVVIPLFWAVRGIDLTDSGFVLTDQRLVFSHPESVSYWFHLWLTNVLGGLVDLAFGKFGLLPHKLASAAIFWAMAGLIFAFYKDIVKRNVVLLALAVSMTYAFVYKINIIHYDNLSALLLLAGAVPLAKAILGAGEALYALSGFLLGLSFFARVPNAVGLCLIFVPPLLKALFGKSMSSLHFRARDFLFFALGALGAGIVCLSAMYFLGHLNIYLDSLKSLLFKSHEIDKGSYCTSKLIKRPLFDTIFALLYGIPATILIVCFSWLISKARKLWMRWGIEALIASAVLWVLLTQDVNLVFIFRGPLITMS